MVVLNGEVRITDGQIQALSKQVKDHITSQ
jgi:hypothetical protein